MSVALNADHRTLARTALAACALAVLRLFDPLAELPPVAAIAAAWWARCTVRLDLTPRSALRSRAIPDLGFAKTPSATIPR